MKVYHKALVVAGLCAGMTLGLTGCGNDALDGSQSVATVGGKTVTLGEANFLLRYQQAETEYYYESMFGEGFYNADLFGNGTTYGETFKEDILNQLQQYYILEDKAADYGVALTTEEQENISKAAASFLEANEAETLAQMTADQETVERVLTLMTLYSKMSDAIYAETEITVTEADAAQRGFTYVSISKGTGDEALTEDEIQTKKDELAAVLESVSGGAAFEDAIEEKALTVSTGTYGSTNASSYDEALINALGGLAEGEMTEVIETEDTLYLAQLTSEYDEEATASMLESLISSEQSAYYNSLMEAWNEEYPLTVEEAVWDDVKFNRSYDLITE